MVFTSHVARLRPVAVPLRTASDMGNTRGPVGKVLILLYKMTGAKKGRRPCLPLLTSFLVRSSALSAAILEGTAAPILLSSAAGLVSLSRHSLTMRWGRFPPQAVCLERKFPCQILLSHSQCVIASSTQRTVTLGEPVMRGLNHSN